MRVVRIYNNNVVVALDENNEEIIVTGKGLAYGKKIGDEIEHNDVEKIFILKDKQVISKLQELLKDTPPDYLTVVDDIINMLHDKLPQEISNNLYLSLIDHIRISLEREKKGIVVNNPLLLEIKDYYATEYKLACRAAIIIEQHMDIRISEDEIGFITMHIVNATMTDRFEDTMLITKMIQNIVCFVEHYFEISLDKDTIKYARFVRHLQFFARRVVTTTKSDGDEMLYRMGRREYPEAYMCVVELVEHLEKQYHHIPSKAEQGYLLHHIQNLLLDRKKDS